MYVSIPSIYSKTLYADWLLYTKQNYHACHHSSNLTISIVLWYDNSNSTRKINRNRAHQPGRRHDPEVDGESCVRVCFNHSHDTVTLKFWCSEYFVNKIFLGTKFRGWGYPDVIDVTSFSSTNFCGFVFLGCCWPTKIIPMMKISTFTVVHIYVCLCSASPSYLKTICRRVLDSSQYNWSSDNEPNKR